MHIEQAAANAAKSVPVSGGRSRGLARRGLAPLELVLSLPIMLLIMALMVNFGTLACWKVRGLSMARLAVWGSRWPRSGDSTPRPAYWPAPGTVGTAGPVNVPQLDDAARGPTGRPRSAVHASPGEHGIARPHPRSADGLGRIDATISHAGQAAAVPIDCQHVHVGRSLAVSTDEHGQQHGPPDSDPLHAAGGAGQVFERLRPGVHEYHQLRRSSRNCSPWTTTPTSWLFRARRPISIRGWRCFAARIAPRPSSPCKT